MKSIYFKTLCLFLFFLPITVLGEEEDPGLPGNGDPGVPITEHLWVLMVTGVALIIYFERKNYLQNK